MASSSVEQKLLASVELKPEWKPEVIASLISAESADVLSALDLDEIWGRPVDADSIAAGSTRERRRSFFEGAETWRCGELVKHGLLTAYSEGRAVGFSECAVVQRWEDAEAKECRICFDSEGELLANCACRGSLRYICEECLVMQWSAKGTELSKLSSMMRCPLCNMMFTGRAADILASRLGAAVTEHERINPEDNTAITERHKAQVTHATTLWQQGKYQDAADLFKQALAGLEVSCGAEDSRTLSALHNLALVHMAMDNTEEAVECLRRVRAGFVKHLGTEHALTLKASHNQGLAAQNCRSWEEAKETYEFTLDCRQRVLGETHIDTLKTAINLGLVYMNMGKLQEAVTLTRETLRRLEQVVGRQHSLAFTAMANLSVVLCQMDPSDEYALRLGQEAAEGRHLLLGDSHPDTLEGFRDLATVLEATDRNEEAEEVAKRALAGMEKVYGFRHHKTQEVVRNLQRMYDSQGRERDSKALLEKHAAAIPTIATKAPEPKPRGPVTLYVLSVYVVSDCRGKGIGRAMMDHWKALSKECSAAFIELWARSSSSSLPFFREGCGMTVGSSPPDRQDLVRLRYAL